MSAGRIKDPAQAEAPAPVMEMARANCAAMLRAKGTEIERIEAEAFEKGERDDSWRMKHEVTRLLSEGLPGAAK